MNRSDISLLKKAYRYWTTRRRALAEIKKLQYDIAISLHAGFPDLLDLSWLAKIPVRIAFDRVFCAPLATQLARYPDNNLFVHQGECQAELLRKLRIEQKHFSNRVSQLAESTDRDLEEVNALLAPRQLGIGRFSVIHMGSGAKFKELPLTFWREVAETLVQDTSIVFTGRGERESNNIAKVMAGLPNCVNAADRLSWRGFVCTLRFAQKLYGVDSLAGHVAAAVGTESVTVHHGAAGPARWRPEGSKATVWTNAVDCSPCNRINGCSSMRCLSEIKPTHVLQRFVAIPSNSPGATRSNTQ